MRISFTVSVLTLTIESAKDDIEALKTSENELVTIEEEIAKGLNVSLFKSVWEWCNIVILGLEKL